jgi:hypothetical protein
VSLILHCFRRKPAVILAGPGKLIFNRSPGEQKRSALQENNKNDEYDMFGLRSGVMMNPLRFKQGK